MPQSLEWIRFLVEIGSIVGSIIWAVASMKASNDVMHRDLMELNRTVQKISNTQDEIQKTVNDHRVAIENIKMKCSILHG